ncbi:MAG: DUF7507 domain-containing protein [Candidatus Heimdallarchaeaceae archaeon]
MKNLFKNHNIKNITISLAFILVSLVVVITLNADFSLAASPICTPSSITMLDKIDIGDLTSEALHLPMIGWSTENIPGGYGGCNGGIGCTYRQVLGEGTNCTSTQRDATVVLHAGSDVVDNLEIEHLDGISLLDSFEVYVGTTSVGTFNDSATTSGEVWKTKIIDVSSYNFTGDLTVRLHATDTIWPSCNTYGQVSIDWIKINGHKACCGDSNTDSTEECDDGNIISGDGCSATCTIEPFCGDSNLDSGEGCDDGNIISGDGCSATCTIEIPVPVCGDGNLDSGEGCDDGTTNGQVCSPSCGSTCNYCTDSCTIALLTGPSCGGGGGIITYYSPKLTIDKSVTETFANPGGTINYTIVVKNTGSAVAYNIILNDTLPSGFTYTDTGLSTREWNLGTIGEGSEETTIYQVFVGEDVMPGNYSNTAEAKSDSLSSVSDDATIEIRAGEVLGAATTTVPTILPKTLPKTGASSSSILFILFASLGSLIFGTVELKKTLIFER